MKTKSTKSAKARTLSHRVKSIDLLEDLDASKFLNTAVSIRRSHMTQEGRQAKPRGSKKFYGDCPSGKVRHRYKEGAIRALRMISNSRKAAEEMGESYRFKQYRIYRCNQCGGGFHLSSKPAFPIVEVADVA